jgi:uncharacterized protein YpiB (UPF0302 family)
MKRKIILTYMLCFALSGLAQAQSQTDTLNIFFDIGKWSIDGNNAKLLDKLAADQNVVSIRIYGYTDFLGDASYNQQLSKKRCTSVSNYLISRGINKKNIIFSKGEGIHPNSMEENRQDLSDKGIQTHRMVQVVYTTNPQAIGEKRANREEPVRPSIAQAIIIKGTESEVAEGDQVLFMLDREYQAKNYRWEKSPNNMAPWTPVGRNTKTMLDEVKSTTWYRCRIDGFVSESFKVTTVKGCEARQGKTTTRRRIYHDNFGRFSAPANYVDAFGTARPAKNWQTSSMPYTIPGHTPEFGTPDDGHYIISTLRKGVMGDWLRGDMTRDTSGDPNGGVLVINVNFYHTTDKAPHHGEIYRQRIDNLCPNVNLYFEVSIANASVINGNSIPPNVTISILTTGGTVLGEANSNLAMDTRGWQRVTIPPFTTCETSVVLKIVSNNTCCWSHGVDLLMDDVIFRVCSPPTVNLYRQDATANNNITLATQLSGLAKKYYEQPRFLYQVSINNGATWRNISGIITESSHTHALNTYKSGAAVLFRMIAASENELRKFIANPGAEDGTNCKTVSISNSIRIII